MSHEAAEPAGEAYVETRLTHSGAVIMVGEHAYKLKRPLRLGFLDFTDVAARREICRKELALNRRLAPDVYLGVGGIDDPVWGTEPVVVMRRLPASRRLAALVQRGTPVEDDMRDLARQVAVFHTHAARGPDIDRQGTRDAIRQRWTDSFREVRGGASVLDPSVTAEIERLSLRFLEGRETLFDARVTAGRVVDGHGDLLAEDVFCLEDGPRVLDCLEFDDRLRFLDQLDDACCLVMDLERLGALGAAATFLDRYLDMTGDPAPPALVHHFIAYRAFVRAKVGCLPDSVGGASAAALHARLCLDHLRRGRVRLVVVGGAPGTGKSTVAGGVADRLGCVAISSDRVRKELAGLDPTASAAADFGAGIYAPDWSRRTYDELLRRAGLLLAMGESVVLDATWRHRESRRLVEDLADETAAELAVFECRLSPEEVARRIAARRGVSDADEDMARRVGAEMVPWARSHMVDTSQSPARAVDDVCDVLAHVPGP